MREAGFQLFRLNNNTLRKALPLAIALAAFVVLSKLYKSDQIWMVPLSLICVWYWLSVPRTVFVNGVGFVLASGFIFQSFANDLSGKTENGLPTTILVIASATVATITLRWIWRIRIEDNSTDRAPSSREHRKFLGVFDTVSIVVSCAVILYVVMMNRRAIDYCAIIFPLTSSAASITILWAQSISSKSKKIAAIVIVVIAYLVATHYLSSLNSTSQKLAYWSSYRQISMSELLIATVLILVFLGAVKAASNIVVSLHESGTSRGYVCQIVIHFVFLLYLASILTNLLMPHGYQPKEFLDSSDHVEVGWPSAFYEVERVTNGEEFPKERVALRKKHFSLNAFLVDISFFILMAILFRFGVTLLFILTNRRMTFKQMVKSSPRLVSLLASTLGLVVFVRCIGDSRDCRNLDAPFYVEAKEVHAPFIERVFRKPIIEKIFSLAGSADELRYVPQIRFVNAIELDRMDESTIETLKDFPFVRSLTVDSEPVSGEMFTRIVEKLGIVRLDVVVDELASLACRTDLLWKLHVRCFAEESRIRISDGSGLRSVNAEFLGRNSNQIEIENCLKLKELKIRSVGNSVDVKILKCPELTLALVRGDAEDSSGVQIADIEIGDTSIENLICNNVVPLRVFNRGSSVPDLAIFLKELRSSERFPEGQFLDFEIENIGAVVFQSSKQLALKFLESAADHELGIEGVIFKIMNVDLESFWDDFEEIEVPFDVLFETAHLKLDETQWEHLEETAPKGFGLRDPNLGLIWLGDHWGSIMMNSIRPFPTKEFGEGNASD